MTDLSGSSEPTFINISERAYKYIRQFTIKNVCDGLIELITNCIDAYNLTKNVERVIEIEIINPDIIKVRDRAIGLTATEMLNCFLQVGNYTASSSSRGFFSRGAKDISALGDVTFNAVKNGKYSRCILSTDAYGSMEVADQDVTDEIRTKYKMQDPSNGLEVQIKLLPNFQHIVCEALSVSVTKCGVLRDIMANANNYIYMREYDSSNNEIFNKRLVYTYPSGNIMLDIEYNVPGYTQYQAHFVVFKSSTPIEQPAVESQLEFGFAMKDNKTIYEINTIDPRFRWNPYMNYLYGYLYCEGISELLTKYDTEGATTTNPYPIIDPSRLTGLNTQHPFVISLLSIPNVRVDAILKALNVSVSSQSVNIADMDSLINELSKQGIDILKNNDVSVSFEPSYTSELAKAIADDRANYVTYEKSYVMNDSYDTEQIKIENYIKENLQKLPPSEIINYSYVMSDDNELYQIPNHLLTDPLNDPVNILESMPTKFKDALQKNPYVYSLTSDNQVHKLYIFLKGKISDASSNIMFTHQKKQFNIVFIRDINIVQRYVIDYSNGITIQINMHNPIVAQYLGVPDDNMSMGNILIKRGSTKTMIFLQELITSIMIDLITENDITNGKLVLDSTGYNNGKKILDYRNRICAKIETIVASMFNNYIQSLVDYKKTTVNGTLSTIKTQLQSMYTLPENLLELSSVFDQILAAVIE